MLRLLAVAVSLSAAVVTAEDFVTKDGPVSVLTWGYQLQGHEPVAIAAAPHDLMVVDFARHGDEGSKFSEDEVAAMQQRADGGRRVVVAYISIGEASEFRTFWRKDWTRRGRARGELSSTAPKWLGSVNPDWPGSLLGPRLAGDHF